MTAENEKRSWESMRGVTVSLRDTLKDGGQGKEGGREGRHEGATEDEGGRSKVGLRTWRRKRIRRRHEGGWH